MSKAPVILMLVFAAALGWILPDLSGHSTGTVAAVAPGGGAPAPSPASPGSTSWAPEPSVLERQSDGHFYVRANVNQTTTRFLVDTGASVVALTGEDARAAGLTWSNEDLVPIGQGASGTVYGVPVTLDSVELGQTEARRISGAIIPQGLPISLLGQSFLSHVDSVRIEGDRMTLGGAN